MSQFDTISHLPLLQQHADDQVVSHARLYTNQL